MDKLIKNIFGEKKSSKKEHKLELGVKKLTRKNTCKSNYYVKKNFFTTFIKNSDFYNNQAIYTKFPQDIDNIGDFGADQLVIKAMVFDKLGRLYIGGSFNRIGNLICNNIAMWDGTKWSSLDKGINSQVLSMSIDSSNNLFVGGSFNGTDTVISQSIIKWNGLKWESLDGGVNANVDVVSTLPSGKIVIGGSFTNSITSSTPLQKIAIWNGANWVNIGADFLNDKSIYGLAVDSKLNKIYIGGYNNLPVSVLDVSSGIWSTLADSNSNVLDQIVNTIMIDKSTGNPVFGGSFGNFGTITGVFNVISFNILTNTWVPFTNSQGYGLDGQCFKLFYDDYNKKIFAGGSFTRLTNGTNEGKFIYKASIWNGTDWEPIGEDINGIYVESFAIQPNGNLFIGGDIIGSQYLYSKGLVIYTNNYVNIRDKKNLLYTLTDFNKSITISNNSGSKYIFQKVIE
jgi:hypothetical protein